MATLTPLDIIKVTRSVQRDVGASGYTALLNKAEEDRQRKEDALRQARLLQEQEQPKNWWDNVKEIVGKVAAPVLSGVDASRSLVQAVANEGGQATRGVGQFLTENSPDLPGNLEALPFAAGELLAPGWTASGGTDKVTDTGINFNDIVANTRNRVSAQDYLDDSALGRDLPGPAKWAVGTGIDIATDPLTYLTAGTGRAAVESANVVERALGKDLAADVLRATRGGTIAAGDDVIRQASERQFGERLAQIAENRNSLPYQDAFRANKALGDLPRPTSLAEILSSDIEAAALRGGTGEAETLLGNRLSSLTNKGGLGLAGYQSGIGQGLGENVLSGLRNSDTGKALRNLFVPTAKVADEFGRGAAEGVDSAIHIGADARRSAIAQAGADAPNVTDDILRATHEAAATDLREQIPNLISDVPKEGFKPLADIYVPEEIRNTIDKAFKMNSNDLARAYDSALGWVKSQITLNPALNPTGVPRNMFGNVLFAAMGGVTKPSQWIEATKLRNTLVKFARESGENFSDDAFRRFAERDGVKWTEAEVERAIKMHQAGLAGRGAHLVDDVAETVGKKPAIGTRTFSKALNWHEETARSAVFLKGIDDGLSASQAAKRAADYMLDYETAALTPFEKDKLQRVVLFYKFPRRVLPMAVEFSATRPGEAIALSRAGLGVAQGERNQYGDALGGYLDTPLEAAYGQLASIVAADNPVEGVVSDLGAPWVKAALNVGQDPRSIENLFPVLDSIDRAKNGTQYQEGGLTGLLAKATTIPGYKEGVDYTAARAEKDLDETAASVLADGKTINGTTALKLLARKEGIPNAAQLDNKTLIDLLLGQGVDGYTIGAILLGKDPAAATEADLAPGGFTIP